MAKNQARNNLPNVGITPAIRPRINNLASEILNDYGQWYYLQINKDLTRKQEVKLKNDLVIRLLEAVNLWASEAKP